MGTRVYKSAILVFVLLLCLTDMWGYAQPNLVLSSTNVAPANFIRLQWTWTPAKPSASYGFTLFQKDNLLSD